MRVDKKTRNARFPPRGDEIFIEFICLYYFKNITYTCTRGLFNCKRDIARIMRIATMRPFTIGPKTRPHNLIFTTSKKVPPTFAQSHSFSQISFGVANHQKILV
jgi:hypothetical protein